jgi:membrane-associated phospholipid phosphatase
MTVTITVVLWLFTSAYATPIGSFPSGQTCSTAAAVTGMQLDQAKPKPFMFSLACVPSVQVARKAPGFSS